MGHGEGHHLPQRQPESKDVGLVGDHAVVLQSLLGLPGLGAHVAQLRVAHWKETTQLRCPLGLSKPPRHRHSEVSEVTQSVKNRRLELHSAQPALSTP